MQFRLVTLLVLLALATARAQPQPEIRNLIGDPLAHILAPGDVVEIVILSLPEQERQYTVRADGGFYLPPIGEVRAAGLTLGQVQKEISGRLGRELRNPAFRVGLTSVAPHRVTVMGEVVHPGSFEVRPGSTVLDVLALASGLTAKADTDQATLMRGSAQQTVSLLPSGPPAVVKDGDVLLALPGLLVSVTGEVNQPGLVSISRDSGDAYQALARAGGAKPNAALSRAILFRPTRDDPVMLNLAPPPRELPPEARHLQEGDVLIMPPRQAIVVQGTPKPVPLNGGENVLDVLVAAGVGENLDDVTIVRQENTAPLLQATPGQLQSQEGRERLERDLRPQQLDLYRYFEHHDESVLVPIHDGDIVLVPEPSKGGFLEILGYILIPLQTILTFRSLWP